MKTIYLIIAWAIAIPTLTLLFLCALAGGLSLVVIYLLAMVAEWFLQRAYA